MHNRQTHTVLALVNGFVCHFDGGRWESSNSRLADTLNTALDLCPQHEPDIRALGERCLQMADFSGQYTITLVKRDFAVEQPS